MKKEKKWLVWNYVNEFPFEYLTKKDAEKDKKIFNKENKETFGHKDDEYYLFKRV